jgi:DNA-binding LytR/AlgR family response regulator
MRAANRLQERLVPPLSSLTSPLSSLTSPLSPLTSENDNVIFLKTDYRIVKVTISDIRYVEAMSEYLKVWLEGEAKPLITLLSMKKMEERLPATFMRIHRSYIINLDKIQEVNKNRVIMDADTYLPIGDLYKEAFQQYVDTKFLGK